MEMFGDRRNINKAWENITGYIRVSVKESLVQHEWKQNKAWFDERCSKFVDQGIRLYCKGVWTQDSQLLRQQPPN